MFEAHTLEAVGVGMVVLRWLLGLVCLYGALRIALRR